MSDADGPGEANENHSHIEAIESLDSAYSTPSIVERYMASIERDLSAETPRYRNIVGHMKRLFLRGGVSLLVSIIFCTFIFVAGTLLGFEPSLSLRVSVGSLVPTWILLYTSMMTDWLPSSNA